MQQLDFLNSSTESYLYSEIEKVRHSMDRRSRAMFALLSELQDQVISLQNDKDKENKYKSIAKIK